VSALGNIIKKEIRELLTPATILPIVIMALIFSTMGGAVGNLEEEMKEKPIIGYIDLDQSNLSGIMTDIFDSTSDVIFKETDISTKDDGLEALKEKDGIALIIIQSDFSDNIYEDKAGEIQIYWIMKGAGIMDSISSTVLEYVIAEIEKSISSQLIEENSSLNASLVLEPTSIIETTSFKGKELVGMSPNDVASILSSQSTFIPIIIMMVIIMAGGTVISSMALEKENKTLETLLTLPVKRVSIVAGKTCEYCRG